MGRGDSNSGTGGGGFKLFGVDINLQDDLNNTSSESSSKKKRILKDEDVDCIRNNKSMGNLHELCNREQHHRIAHDDPGYHSDDLLHLHSGRPAHVRKKGIPWTPSEHRCFLIGLEKLGKGDWKGISKNYVPTRTPAQVASHAQKYFIRIGATEKKNRRASLFDIPYKGFNSPPHASTAASSNASEGSEQVMTAAVDPLKNASENHGLVSQDGLSANIAAYEEKPPLSPAARTNALDACHISYIAEVPGQSFPAAHAMPQTELYPMLNYTYPSNYCDSSSHANFSAHSLFLQLHSMTQGTSQARPATTLAENSAICAPFMNQYQTVNGPPTSTVAKKHGREASSGAPSL